VTGLFTRKQSGPKPDIQTYSGALVDAEGDFAVHRVYRVLVCNR